MSKIINVEVAKLVDALCQPESRTLPKALMGLRADIEVKGVLSPIHVVNGGIDYVIVDGHRRAKIAKELGIKHLQAVVHDVARDEVAALWATLNRNARKITGDEWLVWWYRVDDAGLKCEGAMPPVVLGHIKACMKIFGGKRQLQYLIDQGVGPNVRTLIERLHNIVTRNTSIKAPAISKLGYWIIRHKEQTVANQVCSMPKPPLTLLRKLVTRVQRDQSMSLGDL